MCMYLAIQTYGVLISLFPECHLGGSIVHLKKKEKIFLTIYDVYVAWLYFTVLC